MKKIIAIVGGGPAGMSCALWLKHLGYYPIIIEKSDRLGGLQKINPFHNRWFLGVHGKTGKELVVEFQRHMELESITALLGAKLKEIRGRGGGNFKICTESREIEAASIAIATGQRFKSSEAIKSIPGSDRLLLSNRVCFNPGTIPTNQGQVVAIVGGGDNGLGTVILLADAAKHVHLFVRSHLRGFSMNQKRILEYVKVGKVTLHEGVTIDGFETMGDRVEIAFKEANICQEIAVDYIHFRLGFAPNVEGIVELLAKGGVGSLKLTSMGYIATDSFLRTSIPNVYALGDVVSPRDPGVATAVAHGAIAARSVEEDLRSPG